jgi:thiol-disulfide isomerase/thioredoxin
LNWFNKILIILFIGLTLTACRQNHYKIAKHSFAQEGVEQGQYIPAFSALDSTMQNVHIEQVMNKVTLIDFWASWCRPCRESANPAYKKLYKKYHSKGFNIVGISSDRHQYFWKEALRQDSLPWIQLLDSTHRLLKKFKIKSIPSMLLIDANGQVIGRNLWGKELEMKIDSLLAL